MLAWNWYYKKTVSYITHKSWIEQIKIQQCILLAVMTLLTEIYSSHARMNQHYEVN